MAAANTNTHRGMLQFARVGINMELLSAPMSMPLSENLLDRPVYTYDFRAEHKFLDTAHAELKEMKEAAARKASESRERLASGSSTTSGPDRYSIEKPSVSVEKSAPAGNGGDGEQRPRTSSEEELAAALSASLRDY